MILSRVLAGMLTIVVLVAGVQTYRLDSAKDYHREYVMKTQEHLIAAYKERNDERSKADRTSAEIGNAYNKGVKDANQLHDTTIANLNADNRELRQHWQEALRRARTAESQPTTGGVDGEADAMREDLASFVSEAARADAKIMSLQDQVNAYLCQINREPFPDYQCTR